VIYKKGWKRSNPRREKLIDSRKTFLDDCVNNRKIARAKNNGTIFFEMRSNFSKNGHREKNVAI
jgi:hypothetical protein